MKNKEGAVLRDPAHAAAAGKCWIARMMGGRVGSAMADHPDECAYCEFEPEYIVGLIEEFMHWAGLTPVEDLRPGEPELRPLRASVEGFQMLSREEQARLVRKAQGHTGSVLRSDDADRLSDIWR